MLPPVRASKLRLEKRWSDALLPNLPASELGRLWSFVEKKYVGEKQIFPPESEVFAALDLTRWAKQGVLLLNMALTVEEGASGSHQEEWRFLTEAIIRTLAARKQDLVFIAWGNKAREAVEQIDRRGHKVLACSHPSSRRGGFRGNGHFNTANKYLVSNGNAEIDWRLG